MSTSVTFVSEAKQHVTNLRHKTTPT